MATLHATVRYLEKQGMHYAAQKVQALDERLADVESDTRLSSDPLTALAAVMREHECEFNHGNGVFEIYDRDSKLLLTHKHGTVGHLDIEPGQSNE